MKRIVLCRPSGPRNLGSILRASLNFGPAEIYVVSPGRPSLLVHPDFEQMSHGAEEARDAIRVVDSLDEALAGVAWAVGLTARARGKRGRSDWREIGPRVTELGDDAEETLALVFGSEVEGLTAEEAERCQELAHMRTSAEHTSLNLAHAVTVALHSIFTGTRVHQTERPAKPLSDEGRRFLIARMEEVFVRGVARTPAAGESIRRSIHRVFGRAHLEHRDARAWHLMLRALGSDMAPTDLGLKIHEKDARRNEALERRKELGRPFTEGRVAEELAADEAAIEDGAEEPRDRGSDEG